MKILVTGANGFIGKYVCESLKDNNEVIGIGISKLYEIEGVQYHYTDINSETFIKEFKEKIGKCDVIIHLAALIDKSNTNKKLIDVNCSGSISIVELAKELEAKKIINLSSLPLIGVPTNIPITEEHPTNPITLYHVSKLGSEHILNLAIQSKIEVVHIRIPAPVGVGMNMNTIVPIMLKNAINDQPITIYGKGGRQQNYIDVRDIANCIKNVVNSATKESNLNNVYNIGSKEAISNLDFAKLCIKLTESKSEIIYNNIPDPEENYDWNISTEKAEKEYGFEVEYTLEDSLNALIKELRD